jgi:prolyl oligopeptidase PreP (S9A serine peptidase family)
MVTTMLTEQQKLTLRQLFSESSKTLEYLYDRWQDEKEYEDIKDYAIPLTPAIEKAGGTNIKMLKRPFAVQFNFEGKTVQFYATSRQMGFKVE